MRYQYLDILRWLCILLMVVFHLNYSLVHIFDSEILNFSEIFWNMLWRVAAIWFITIAGASYFLASQKYTGQELQLKYIKYAGVLFCISLGITATTYVLIPEQLIVFGILHFFAVSFLLLPLVTRIQYGAIITLLFLLLVSVMFEKQVQNSYAFPLWFYNSDFRSADYYPLVPYFWYMLGWYLMAQTWKKYNFLSLLHLKRKLYFYEKCLSMLGKKSLMIYLIHQPIIIGVIWSIIGYM